LAFVQVLTEKRKKLDERASCGIFDGYSILTEQHFVYDPLALTLDLSSDVVVREGKRYTSPKAADEGIFNNHFYQDVSEQPEPTEKEPTECQTEE
jgi:hypothetical protein